MTAFLLDMQNKFDRPLVDQTGLDGHYDFALRWTPNEAPSDNADAPPGMFTAIQEQLGLKMLAGKGTCECLGDRDSGQALGKLTLLLHQKAATLCNDCLSYFA